MANITFPRAEIEKHIKLDEKTIEQISMFGTSIKVSGHEVEIEVFPNRPDLLSQQGFLRAIKAFLGKESGLKIYKVKNPEPNYKVKIDSSVKDIRPYIACAIVKNLSFNNEKIKEIIELQEKIHATLGRNRKKLAIGIYPLDKITLPITYLAKKPEDITFAPLESTSPMSALEILKQNPAGRAYAHLLEGKEKFPIFMDAKKNILSLPPIINSNETGKISTETKEVFIECSGFDFSLLQKTLAIIVTALAEQGGTIYSMRLDYGKEGTFITPQLNPEKMKISLENINSLIGLKIKDKEAEKLLAKMGLGYKNKSVLIPAWRFDILHEVDIAEEIAIAYGYNNLKPESHSAATIAQESREYALTSALANLLTGLQFQEISSYHLIKEEEALRSHLTEKEIIPVENSKTEYRLLRPNLLIPALRILGENKDSEYPQKLFELGKTFIKDAKTESGIRESLRLLIAASPANVTYLIEIFSYLTKMLSLNYQLKKSIKQGLIEGRTASIIINGKTLGYLGELHPETLRNWNIKMPLAVLEICLDEVLDNS